MKRKLFCELSPLTYRLAVEKNILVRKTTDLKYTGKFALAKSSQVLPVVVYKHNSFIQRKLGNVQLTLQENKAVNLKLATPKVSHVLIKPGEIFSFWKLVGACTEKKGYKEGLMVGREEETKSGIGGGMCQFTNLIHWLVLHTPLVIIEHHHHDGIDMFPDYGRKVPFGTGTSIVYNYLDYRFINPTNQTFQLITYTDDTYLYGEVRCERPLLEKYHIKVENEYFSREEGVVYRNSTIYRSIIDKKTGNVLTKELVKKNHAKILYDSSTLPIVDEPKNDHQFA